MILYFSQADRGTFISKNNFFYIKGYKFFTLIKVHMDKLDKDQIEDFNMMGWCFYDVLSS